jgi:hypothetical protein
MDANSLTPDDNPLDYDTCLDPKWDGCGQTKPIDQFRPKSPLCKACERRAKDVNKQMAVVEASQKAAHVELGRLFLEEEKRKRKNLPALSQALNLVIDNFGGYEQWANSYYRNIIAAEEGSKTALDAYHRLMTGLAMANQQEMNTGDVNTMENSDLSALLGQMISEAHLGKIVDGTAKRIEQQDAGE